jgi:hypothetical protein
MFSGWLLPRVSSDSARARRSTKTSAPDCTECSAVLFLFQRAQFYSIRWRRIQRPRGKKSVILALHYFSAAAGDALSPWQEDTHISTTRRH